MEKLLEETNLSYYWIGFILADGHISKNNRLKVGLAIKDIKHLKQLAEYLNIDKIKINKHKKSCNFNKQSNIVKEVKNKFNIDNNKTIKPPDLNNYINNERCIKYAGYLFS